LLTCLTRETRQNRRNVTTAVKCTLIAGIGCILAAIIACRHQAVAASHPKNTPPLLRLFMQPDQVNTAEWDKGWKNLLNDAEQSFTSSLPK
jgi:hypothetical protein